MIGETISHYKIIEKLGAGGIGVVYKALDTRLHRTVVLKFLSQALSNDPEAIERFKHEAQTASALDHQNVCHINAIDETKDGQVFIDMNYYAGKTLRDKIVTEKNRTPLPLEEAISIFVQITQGLARAHKKGIVHRDIKPANIIITDDDEVKIVDFGLAKLAGQSKLTQTGTPIGTVNYMSPEQARGKDVDHRSDIWSLGVVLYEMLTGDCPFRGDYEQAVIYSILHDIPESTTKLNTNLPQDLDLVVTKCLNKDINERYQSAEELLADFKKILNLSDATIAISLPSRLQIFLQKKYVKPVLAYSLITIVLIVGFLVLWPMLSKTRSVAVIGFKNQTGESLYNHLSGVIPNYLITSLQQSGELNIVSWYQLKDMMRGLDVDSRDISDEETGFRLCEMGDIDVLISGIYTLSSDRLIIDVKAIDVDSKNFLSTSRNSSSFNENVSLQHIDQISEKVSYDLGVSAETIQEKFRSLNQISTKYSKAMDLYVKGREAYSEWKLEPAAKFLERAIELDTSFVSAYFWLSTVYIYYPVTAEKKSRVRDKIFRDSEMAPEREREYIHLMTRIPNRGARMEALQDYVERYPDDKNASMMLALDAMVTGNMDVFVDESKRLLKMDPRAAIQRMKLATYYADNGQYDEAIFLAEEGTQFDPENPENYATLGEMYMKKGDLETSIEMYKKAQSMAGEGGREEDIIAYFFALKEDYSRTISWLKKALMCTGPGRFGFPRVIVNTMNHSWLTLYYFRLGQIDSSLYHVEEAAKLAKDSPASAFNNNLKGWLAIELGDFKAGKEYYDRSYDDCLNLIPSGKAPCNMLARVMYAHYYLKSGKADSAVYYIERIKEFLHLFKFEEKAFLTYVHRVLYCEQLITQDSLDAAERIFRKINPQRPLWWWWGYAISYQFFNRDMLARIYIKKGYLDKAIKEYQRLLRFDPRGKEYLLMNPKLHYKLAKLYEQTNQPDSAIAEYQKFLAIWKNANPDNPELADSKNSLKELM